MAINFFKTDRKSLRRVIDWATQRIDGQHCTSATARSATELEGELGGAITAGGVGSDEALRLFTDTIVPATRAQADPMNVAYVPTAPTPASVTFDLAVSAAEIFAGTWETGAGAIHAENQALAWLSELAGWPSEAGGTFVPGGTVGNLSALHAARQRARRRGGMPPRWRLAVSSEVHSSVRSAASVLDVDLLEVPVGPGGRMTGADLAVAIGDHDSVFAVVATGGTTNAGVIDDLRSIGEYCGPRAIWFHVDGAYGLAAMASPRERPKFDGIELADSFVVDPHKWLFAPYDCCALVYREPSNAVAAHSQIAPYLDQIDRGEWNPCDYAIQLSRRARGLPFWFSLATYGTDAYAAAIEKVVDTASEIAERIDWGNVGELIMWPDLSVILVRVPRLDREQLGSWSEDHRLGGTILCVPTTHKGETVLRICLVNPDTEADDVIGMLETLVS